MAEWSNAAVLKTVDLNGSGGSNPSLSANKLKLSALRWAFFVQGRREPRSCKALHGKRAQRKIPVDLHFIVRLRHKASGAALGLSCAVCFEQPAGVFAGCGAVCQAKILASLKIKNGISLTPLN